MVMLVFNEDGELPVAVLAGVYLSNIFVNSAFFFSACFKSTSLAGIVAG